jgi:SAM-dependent methyltransferase
VLAAVPFRGAVLEIGCGHGLASALLAATSTQRDVVGVDVDAAKVAVGQRAAARLTTARPGTRLQIRLAEGGGVPDGPWDAIVVVDVLYLLDEAGQRRLLTEAAERLAPGGTLVVKEMAADPAWKAGWNRAQERMSVRVLGLTAGTTLCFVPIERQAAWLADVGLEVEVRRLDRGSPHPHALLVARRT